MASSGGEQNDMPRNNRGISLACDLGISIPGVKAMQRYRESFQCFAIANITSKTNHATGQRIPSPLFTESIAAGRNTVWKPSRLLIQSNTE